MKHSLTNSRLPSALKLLGWSDFFVDQIKPAEADLVPLRVASVHRARIEVIGVIGPAELELPPNANTADFAAGDWVLADPISNMFVSRLDRKTVFQRRPEVGRGQQLVAANVDTLLTVTSCNADFNVGRLERYLIMANQAGTKPVIVLTKADNVNDVGRFQTQAEALQRVVIAANEKSPSTCRYCGDQQVRPDEVTSSHLLPPEFARRERDPSSRNRRSCPRLCRPQSHVGICASEIRPSHDNYCINDSIKDPRPKKLPIPATKPRRGEFAAALFGIGLRDKPCSAGLKAEIGTFGQKLSAIDDNGRAGDIAGVVGG